MHNEIISYPLKMKNFYSFRNVNVKFKNVSWQPPLFGDLPYYWPYINSRIIDMKRIFENALVIFLQLSRIQFFSDANKRAAILFVNGILLKNCLMPFIVPSNETQNFSKLLTRFYENGKANNILDFFIKTSIADFDNIKMWTKYCSSIDYHNLSLNKRRSFVWV